MKISKLQIFRLLAVLICLGAAKLIGGGRIGWLWLSLTVVIFGPFYCGWTCPFGTISRLSNELGRHFLPKFQLHLPEQLDRYLPIFKYLSFFCFLCVAVFPQYGFNALKDVVPGVKTLESVRIVFGLPVAIFAANFYCRYFCWHKAHYNLFGLLSPAAITVDTEKCIGCNACQKVCPMNLKPNQPAKFKTDCVMCMQCVEACPKNVQAARFTFYGRPVSPYVIGTLYLIVYISLLLAVKYLNF